MTGYVDDGPVQRVPGVQFVYFCVPGKLFPRFPPSIGLAALLAEGGGPFYALERTRAGDLLGSISPGDAISPQRVRVMRVDRNEKETRR